MPSTYDIGDLVRVTGQFSTSNSTVYIDPTTVTLHMEIPAGTVTSYSVSPPTTSSDIVRSTTGEFYHEKLTTASGSHQYRWTSTGNVTASQEGTFLVRARLVTT